MHQHVKHIFEKLRSEDTSIILQLASSVLCSLVDWRRSFARSLLICSFLNSPVNTKFNFLPLHVLFALNLIRGAEGGSYRRVDISRMQRSAKRKLTQYPKASVSYSESRKAAVVLISKRHLKSSTKKIQMRKENILLILHWRNSCVTAATFQLLS